MTEPSPTSAVVTRLLSATPQEVYDAWTDPASLAGFICPPPTTPGTIECDPRVGGGLRIDMIGPDGVTHIVGRFLDVDPPQRLRFTWSADLGDGFDSVVTVTLQPSGVGQTLMTIEHAQLPPEWAPDHVTGWTAIADQLDGALRSGG